MRTKLQCVVEDVQSTAFSKLECNNRSCYCVLNIQIHNRLDLVSCIYYEAAKTVVYAHTKQKTRSNLSLVWPSGHWN